MKTPTWSRRAGIDFAQAAAPLSGHTDRHRALLGEPRRIKDDDAIGVTDLLADLGRQRLQQRLVVPRHLADELLQTLSLLVVQVSDRLARLAFELGEQALDIFAGMGALLRFRETLGIGLKELLQSCQRSSSYLGMADGGVQHLLQSRCKAVFHDTPRSNGERMEGIMT